MVSLKNVIIKKYLSINQIESSVIRQALHGYIEHKHLHITWM